MFVDVIHALTIRASNDDEKCGKNDKSAQCERPVQSDGLTIGLSVGLPVAAVFIVLSYFLFRNYRKGKKEAMEHDPDFDENGEATALPDFPSNHYQMEDPFDNRNSLRFPPGGYGHQKNMSHASLNYSRDPYLDNVVLPYQHQTGSKVSLDEYARQLGDINQAYVGGTPNASYYPRTRGSSISNSNYLTPSDSAPVPKSASVSPTKSNLKYEIKKSERSNYQNVANHSLSDINDTMNETSLAHTTNSRSGSDSEESKASIAAPDFSISYENESEPAINETLPSTSRQTVSRTLPDPSPEFDVVDPEVSMNDSTNGVSPFEDTVPSKMTVHRVEETIDGDFDFSNDTQSSHQRSANDDVGVARDESETANTSTSNLDVAPRSAERKSPRISAFNLLKNDSDDEENENDGLGEDDEGAKLSPEQEEELKRMKSVYKLYFDRSNSVRRPEDGNEEAYQDQYEFQADPDQPLPDIDHLRINNELTTDTNYHKRLTTTSSIYTENPVFTKELYNNYLQDENFQQFYHQHQVYAQQYQEPMPPLPPLQHLPHPSDLRKSTIQTYTDFQPKVKQGTTSPNIGNRPFVPIENEGVWNSSSPATSPVTSSSPQFNSQGQQRPQGVKTVPSASQLARSSVVMLNPVTEITKQRKFKPAGSLPSGHVNNHAYNNYPQYAPNHHIYEQNNSSGDLIPNTKKGDIRRVMNNI